MSIKFTSSGPESDLKLPAPANDNDKVPAELAALPLPQHASAMDRGRRHALLGVTVMAGGILAASLLGCSAFVAVQSGDVVGTNENDDDQVDDRGDPKLLKGSDVPLTATPSEGSNDPAARALLDFLGKSEGTAARPGDGYSTSLDFGRWLPGGREQELPTLSLSEIDVLQKGMLSQPGNVARYPGGGSSALGRYQIVRRTLLRLRAQLHLSGDQLFDAALQDRLALELARRRGATKGLGSEWASLTGKKLEKAIDLAKRAFDVRR